MIRPEVLRALHAAGATAEMIIAAVEADLAKTEEEGEARASVRRRKDAERQRRYRLSRNVTRDVTLHPVTVRDNSLSPKEKSPTPSKEITPIPQNSSLRSEQNYSSSAGDPVIFDLFEKQKRPPRKASDEDDLEEIRLMWNDFASERGLRQSLAMTAKLEGKIRGRIRDAKVLGFADGKSMFRALFDKIRKSPILLDRQSTWFGFDWILIEDNLLKIMEGKYEKGNGKTNGFGNGYGQRSF